MRVVRSSIKIDPWIFFPVVILTTISLFVLRSVASSLFPLYFLYTLAGFIVFFIFARLEFEVFAAFSKLFYIGCIVFLFLPLIIGQVTRGTVRWIPLGGISIQPAEIVRPFLLIFFGSYLCIREFSYKRAIQGAVLAIIPVFLIFIQPSLGVSFLTLVAFLGVLLASKMDKRLLLGGLLTILLIIPFGFHFLAPYQKTRVNSFINPEFDPQGVGYNSIQSVISVGSGKLFGRGLGKGIQTQLAFLPEKHTDFIFAAISEELGFVGAAVVLLAIFIILYRLAFNADRAASFPARGYLTGVFVVLTVQTVVNVAMNLGIFPVAGLPFPLVSAGGSSYLSTMIMLGIAVGAVKR